METKGILRRRRRRDERGAVAIIVAVLAMGLLMLAALGVDIGLQINNKHQLYSTLDSAAQSGASKLPGWSAAAKTMALDYAKTHDPTETAPWRRTSTSGAWSPRSGAVRPTSSTPPRSPRPATRAPRRTRWALYKSTNRKVSCSAALCAIPCVEPSPNTGTPKFACNTIRVFQGKVVDFNFAPAGGIEQGYTGDLVSVACKGSCGTVAPNPLDVAIIADRTKSMEQRRHQHDRRHQGHVEADVARQQYVALGTIGRSVVSSPQTSGTCTTGGRSPTYGLSYPSDSLASPYTQGAWIPIAFSNNYASAKGTLSTSRRSTRASSAWPTRATPTRSWPPRSRRRRATCWAPTPTTWYLPPRSGDVRKVLVLETDGQPNEPTPQRHRFDLHTGRRLLQPARHHHHLRHRRAPGRPAAPRSTTTGRTTPAASGRGVVKNSTAARRATTWPRC